MNKVIIVESPSKSKTIESYLDKSYKVLSSVGHIRDLQTSGKDGLGIDIENGFVPKYRIIKGKDKLVEELKKSCKGKQVFLATDPDREGEAISFHLATVLGLDFDSLNRIEFHEITKPAVLQAFDNPRKIDMNLVHSQEARRMLDRIIGFKVSKLLQSRIKSQSAGRVQSVALKLIVDLEKEINEFVPEAYYDFVAHFNGFDLKLESHNNIKDSFKDKNEAIEFKNNLNNDFIVDSIEQKQIKRESKPPFTTSTMAQDASNKLGFNSSKTMRIAQALYEGLSIKGEHMGLITYMRTDSTHLSDVFVNEAYKYIEEHYGKDYKGFRKEKKQMLAQDAHEAIRPTSIYNTPESVKPYLSNDEYKLYNLIYIRAISSLMAGSKYNQTKVLFNNVDSVWSISGLKMEFDGYVKVYGLDEDEANIIIPKFNKGEKYTASDIEFKELFTKPKSRYTEATLIKDMEKQGIGRPSTYAQTMTTLKDRGYIKEEKKKLIPTEQGILTTNTLDEYFSKIINVEYTANMESELDKIAKGTVDATDELERFYNDFMPLFEEASDKMNKIYPKPTGKMCPECGGELVIRKGKYGEFTACSNYPKCKYVMQEEVADEDKVMCPNCGDGYFIKREIRSGSSRGRTFYSCSNYNSKTNSCNTIFNDKPINKTCPKCGSIMLVDNNGVEYCSKRCDEVDDYEPILCPKCGKGHLQKRLAQRGKNKGNYFYACDNRGCGVIYNDTPTTELCPKCSSIMLKDKDGNLYCSNSCDEAKDEVNNIKCPNCETGYLIKRQASRGRNKGGYFYGCSNYPKCKTIYNETDELCPKCSSKMIKNGESTICTNPDCK